MKKIAFLIHIIMNIFLILTIISFISTQELTKTSEQSPNSINDETKSNEKINTKINVINSVPNMNQHVPKYTPKLLNYQPIIF